MRIYYGYNPDEDRVIYATVTGEMADGSLVYTEIAQGPGGEILKENGEPKLILDNQFFRRLRYGTQTFTRI